MADIIISRTKNDSEQSDICSHGTFAIDSLCQMKFKPNCSLNKRHFILELIIFDFFKKCVWHCEQAHITVGIC